MDPNTALHDLREAIRDAEHPDQYTDREVAIEQVAASFEALDGWLSRGGALPEEWGARALPPTPGGLI